MIQIKEISKEQFLNMQYDYSSSNFQQSVQMYNVQKKRNHLYDIALIGIYNNNVPIGQSVVLYKKIYKFFKEAIIIHGPLMNYDNLNEASAVFDEFIKYFKENKVSRFSFSPYLENNIFKSDLEVIKKNKY